MARFFTFCVKEPLLALWNQCRCFQLLCQPTATEATQAIPELEKDLVAWCLEHPFRPDQIKLKDGVQDVDGASVIQRLNDVLGTANWSFRILGDPVQLEKEVIIRAAG
ncbi:MAG: hypothetical protein EHM23_19835 [Acidobacteria bacterium]|nr:MAG: hypothetical protein EHM23_19835 [Acidobacteriota bacterium]